jgi:hypothetical protein
VSYASAWKSAGLATRSPMQQIGSGFPECTADRPTVSVVRIGTPAVATAPHDGVGGAHAAPRACAGRGIREKPVTTLPAPASQAAPEPLPTVVGGDTGSPGRIVLLLAIVALAALWLQHHLGFEFKNLGIIAFAVGAWGTMGKIADWVGEKSATGRFMDSTFKAPVSALFRSMTRTGPLYLVGGVVALVMATISSVTVRSEIVGELSVVSLGLLDTKSAPAADTLTRDKALVRFLPVLTSPFGRLYQIDAQGYTPSLVTVYPLIGRQVVLGRDLAPSPSVLFRPFGEGVVALEDGGEFTVSRLRDGRAAERLAVSGDSGTASSFLLGRRKPLSDATMVFWTLEATASGAPEAVRAKLLVTWRSPKQLQMSGELAPRDCLLAEIRLHGQLKERAVVALTDSPIVDVLMHGLTTDTVKAPSC